MSFFQAIISGFVQGITEFLPVSSSGHLVLLHKFMDFTTPGIAFDVFLHIGTLLAVFLVFWKDILSAFTSRKRIGLYVVLGSFVTGLFVFLFSDRITPFFSDPKSVAVMLVVTGIWLFSGKLISSKKKALSAPGAFIIGLAQGVATIPGISRSGSTISTGLMLGLEPRTAAGFSFLLSIPATIGAVIFETKDGIFSGITINHIAGLISACIVGVLSLKLLLRMLYSDKLYLFGFYCLIAGLTVFVIL